MNKKFEKRKKREQKVKEKLLKRREAAMEQHRTLKEQSKKPLYRDKLVPIMGEAAQKKWNEARERKIEHNLEVLEQVYQEMIKEQLYRKEINDKLESMGAVTADDKAKLLGQLFEQGETPETLLNPPKKRGKFGGSWEVKFTPNQ